MSFVGGNFSGTSPFVFVKLAANRFGRIRSHFERLIPEAELDILVSESQHVNAMRSAEAQQKREMAHKEQDCRGLFDVTKSSEHDVD